MQFPTTGIFYCVLRSLSEAFRTNCRSVSRTEGQRGADYTILSRTDCLLSISARSLKIYLRLSFQTRITLVSRSYEWKYKRRHAKNTLQYQTIIQLLI